MATPTNAQIQIIDDLIGLSGFDVDFGIQALLRAIFVHDAFYDTQAAPFTLPTPPKSVKWPVDFVVGTLRMLGIKGKGGDLVIEGGDYSPVRDHLENMGQMLLDHGRFGKVRVLGRKSIELMTSRVSFP